MSRGRWARQRRNSGGPGSNRSVGDMRSPQWRSSFSFGVTLVHGPGWDPSRQIRTQDGWDEHAAFMDGLVDDGFIIVGGPLGEGDRTLHVVEAADERQIEARFGADPWAVAGLLRIGSIEPWALWLDGRR